jgi:hypothetical protein
MGGEAFVHVPDGSIEPGRSFTLLASDLEPNAPIQVRLLAESRTAELGSVASDAEGHFETTLSVPADFPTGYARLIATDPAGNDVETWVSVGPAGSSAAPSVGAGAQPSLYLATALAIGLLGLGAVIWLARRRAQSRTDRAPPRR